MIGQIMKRNQITRPTPQYIGSKCTGRTIYEYKKCIDDQFTRHRIYDKVNDMYDSIFLSISQYDIEQIEKDLIKVDQIITEIVLASEKRCNIKKFPTDWSLSIHYNSVKYRLLRKYYKGLHSAIYYDVLQDRLYHTLPKMDQDHLCSIRSAQNQTAL